MSSVEGTAIYVNPTDPFASLSAVSTSQDGSAVDLGFFREHHAMFVVISGSLGTSSGTASIALEASWDNTDWISVAQETASSSNFLTSPVLLTYDGPARYLRASLSVPSPAGGGTLTASVVGL